jgi:hypothetical protein
LPSSGVLKKNQQLDTAAIQWMVQPMVGLLWTENLKIMNNPQV